MDSSPEFELDPLDHVAIAVDDLDRAIAWYQSSFKCELLFKERQQAVLRFANLNLQLVLPSLQQPHVAFRRSDAATLGALREQIGGAQSTFIADPTGNIVEIVAAAATEEQS